MSLSYIKQSCEQNSVPTFSEDVFEQDLDLRNLSVLSKLTTRIGACPNLVRCSIRKSHLTASGLSTLILSLTESQAKLYELNIAFNDLYRVEDLKPLQNLLSLQSLDVSNCPLCDIQDWRDKVLSFLPWLRFLNNEPTSLIKQGNEANLLKNGGEVLEKCENFILQGSSQWIQGTQGVDYNIDITSTGDGPIAVSSLKQTISKCH
jgi:hypothetical protein